MNIQLPMAVQILANKLATAEAACAVLMEKLGVAEQENAALKAKAKKEASDA